MKPEPWKGEKFCSSDRFLILGESGYLWKNSRGRSSRPGKLAARASARWMMQEEPWKPGYPRDGGKTLFKITRALTNSESPAKEARARAWHSCAFINYVHIAGENRRPTTQQLVAAQQPFLDLLERLRPRRVLALGKTMWKQMPPNCVPGLYRRNGDLQAYQLADGSLVWVLALKHPSRGPSWHSYATEIAKFRKQELPHRLASP